MGMAWIRSARVDLTFFHFGWIIPCLAFLLVTRSFDANVCGYEYMNQLCSHWTLAVVAAVSYMLDTHRWYTFPLVYGVKEEFAKHRRLYTWLPIALFAVFGPLLFYKSFPEPYSSILLSLIPVVVAPNFFFNTFHIMMQKYGIFRIYAAKLGYGNAKLEKTVLLSWFVCMVILLFRVEDTSLGYYVNATFSLGVRELVNPLFRTMRLLGIPAAIWTAGVTIAWLVQEIRNFKRANIPKLVYAAATFMVLGCFFYSLVLGYIAFAASHTLEYIAFVNLYGRRKPGIPLWIRSPLLLNPIVILFVVAFYASLRRGANGMHIFFLFSYYESYLHFVYDGVLWKLRDPAVRDVVLRMKDPVLAGNQA
jgi:hypothetical protein